LLEAPTTGKPDWLAIRGIVNREQLLLLLDATPFKETVLGRIRDRIERNFR
jgi:hypothetical protein